MFHGQRINLYFVIIKIYKLYGIFHFICNTPPILLAREKIPAPLPTRGRQGGRCGPAGGAAGARSAHKARAGRPKGPLPLLWFGWPGGPKAPPAAKRRRPPRDAAVSCYPTGSPPYFPSVTHHTPKAFWKPPKAVSKAEPFAALGEAPLTPFASRERPTPLPLSTSAPQLLRGLGAEPPPAGVQGRGRPWPWRSQFPYALRRPPFLSDLAQTPPA